MAEMFGKAGAYERMMGRWSKRLAPQFADFVRIRDHGRLLDVGCGTGSLVQCLADATERSAIVGVDPSAPFIDYARSRFPGSRFSFDVGNAMELPYSNGCFDQSLSLLVFMFIPQPRQAASEMRRVTRGGGTVAACVWDSGGGGLEMNKIFWEEAAALDPAAETLQERPRHCNRQGELAELWRGAGLDDVEEVGLEIRTDFSCLDDYWLPFSGGVGPQGVYVAALASAGRDALRDRLRKRLLADRPDGPFSLRAKAWAVRGSVPKR